MTSSARNESNLKLRTAAFPLTAVPISTLTSQSVSDHGTLLAWQDGLTISAKRTSNEGHPHTGEPTCFHTWTANGWPLVEGAELILRTPSGGGVRFFVVRR